MIKEETVITLNFDGFQFKLTKEGESYNLYKWTGTYWRPIRSYCSTTVFEKFVRWVVTEQYVNLLEKE